MLRIDRMRADVEILPNTSTPNAASNTTLDSSELRRMVLEILRDELRALERRGAL